MEEKLEQLHQMMSDLIGIVGKTNSMLMEQKQDISGLKQDVSELKQDVSVLKQDVSELKQELAETKSTVERIEGKLELLGKRVDRHTHQIADIQEKLDLEEMSKS